MAGGSEVWQLSWISLLMRQCLLVHGLQSHPLQICIISLISSKFHLFGAELDLQWGSCSTGRCGAHSWTISHPEGLPSGHTMHTYMCSSCFPVPLRHSSQQVSSEKVRPQMSGQIKRKSIQNTLGQKTFVDCTHSNMHSTLLSFPQETKYKITLEWGDDLKCPEFWVYLLIIFTWWGKVVRKFKAIWTFLTEKFHFKHSKIFKNFF